MSDWFGESTQEQNLEQHSQHHLFNFLANTEEEENLRADIPRLESELRSYSTERLEDTNNLQTIQESERNGSNGLEETNNLRTIQESETDESDEEVHDIVYVDVELLESELQPNLSHELEDTNSNLHTIQEPETNGSLQIPDDIVLLYE